MYGVCVSVSPNCSMLERGDQTSIPEWPTRKGFGVARRRVGTWLWALCRGHSNPWSAGVLGGRKRFRLSSNGYIYRSHGTFVEKEAEVGVFSLDVGFFDNVVLFVSFYCRNGLWFCPRWKHTTTIQCRFCQSLLMEHWSTTSRSGANEITPLTFWIQTGNSFRDF